jgi:flavin-dependent dehydrogenase
MGKERPVNIVGAGLAGLTAAVILARQGREVTVHEKGNRVGGMPLYNPSPHGTPMDVERMNSYVGFDLRPGLVPMQEGVISIWGKRYHKRWPSGAPSYMIERGPRRSSMDHYLADLAREEGACVLTGRPVLTDGDVAALNQATGMDRYGFPSGVIMATGLHVDGYEAAQVPYQTLYGYFAKCRVPWPEPRVTIYFDDYTPDYAFTCSVNGIAFGLIFNRHRPIRRWEWEKFAHQAVELDGYPFKKFMPLEGGAAPVKRFGNPRLFHGNLILAGTLAGMMDPILFFGMHGAFISGKIAAMALDDPVGAWKEFRRVNATFKPVLAVKRLLDVLPRGVFIKYPGRLAMALWPLYADWATRYAFMVNISGYNRI